MSLNVFFFTIYTEHLRHYNYKKRHKNLYMIFSLVKHSLIVRIGLTKILTRIRFINKRNVKNTSIVFTF